VTFRGRPYGLTRSDTAGGRASKVYAEELGGRDVVSANVYRTSHGVELRSCEMPDATVLAFLQGWEEPSATVRKPCQTPHRSSRPTAP
jgi:hypothetical protein